VVRRPRAGQSNSGEPFRPWGGDLWHAKAWASFSRGRGDTWTYFGELDEVKSASHRASTVDRRGRAPAKGKVVVHRRNRGNWAWGRVSHLGAELRAAWSGLRRAGWSGTGRGTTAAASGVGRARETVKLCEMRRRVCTGH
jgi:hypothetical protein